MPTKSKSQQSAFGMALAAKRKEIPIEALKGAAKQLYRTMSEGELAEYAHSDRKPLPKQFHTQGGRRAARSE